MFKSLLEFVKSTPDIILGQFSPKLFKENREKFLRKNPPPPPPPIEIKRHWRFLLHQKQFSYCYRTQ